VVNAIQRKAKYGQIKEDNERIELWCHLYAYVTATSLPLSDLDNFDRLIFVAQSVPEKKRMTSKSGARLLLFAIIVAQINIAFP
jgi:hypothetical protein